MPGGKEDGHRGVLYHVCLYLLRSFCFMISFSDIANGSERDGHLNCNVLFRHIKQNF